MAEESRDKQIFTIPKSAQRFPAAAGAGGLAGVLLGLTLYTLQNLRRIKSAE